MGSDSRHKHSGAVRQRWALGSGIVLLAFSVTASTSIVGTASATAGVAPRAVSSAAAEGDPQQVLQSVSVGLGPDGSITGIDSTNISKTGDADLVTDDESYDPAQVAGGLPVRILTSYRLGDRSGTDLSEIAGESGRVVIEVVVQNTTVRPQKLTYDVDSTQRSQYALVGAPLTVVATADIGDGGLSRVVTTDGAGRNDSDTVTNGVLSRTDSGNASVQWASLLAPPRLSPSSTFRLVEETDDFEVPTFDINVQPGLVTDTSIRNLLEAAFSDEAGSTLQLEGRTIKLIGDVTGALEVASSGLSDVEELLDTSARTIGQRTISDLQASSDRITGELSGLVSDLDGLDSDIDSQLTTTQSSTLSQLSSTVTAIKNRLGDPDTTREPAPIKVTGCSFDFSDKIFGKKSTVFQQLLRVRGQLSAIGDASRACAVTLAASLRASIGSTDPGYTCDPAAPSLICSLGETKQTINQKAVDLSVVGTNVAGRFDAARLVDLRSSVDDVNTVLGGIQDTAAVLADGDGGESPLLTQLLSIQAGLVALQVALQPDAAGGIEAALDDIHSRALAARTALGSSAGVASVSQQAQDAADAACTLALETPAVPPVPPVADPRDLVSTLLTGRTCSGADADLPDGYGGLSVAERAEAASAAVDDIIGLSDLADPGNPVVDQLDTLRSSVSSLASVVLGLITTGAPNLQLQVRALSDRLAALGAGISALPTGTTCPSSAPGAEDELTALNRSFRRIFCQQVGLESYITDKFGEAGSVLDDVQGDLTDGQSSADAARSGAERSVNTTTARLSNRLDRAGTALRDRGAKQIKAQRRSLDAELGDVTRLLDANITSAITLIDTRVRAANGNIEESQARLVGDLSRVLTDIGQGRSNGTGLLGALASGASDTRLSNQSIVRVTDTASAFSNVRSAAMEDTLLQQAQLTRSLELQQLLPAFGLDLPAGSQHVSVYSFHLGQE
ncbi:hypothetical protein BH11ACT8_BH11ACT8_35130 [soil metagenome]